MTTIEAFFIAAAAQSSSEQLFLPCKSLTSALPCAVPCRACPAPTSPAFVS